MEDTFATKLTAASDWLSGEYAAIRSGQATPALLDAIKVESYGTKVPVNQVASVGIEDARTLRVSPWDTESIAAVETAINDANLGVSVATDSTGLRIIFPELTGERREQLLKLAKGKQEEARVRVRAARDDEMKRIEAAQKSGELSEDEAFAAKEAAQKAVEESNQRLDAAYHQKETELQA
jgi:ribosome recycling factor